MHLKRTKAMPAPHTETPSKILGQRRFTENPFPALRNTSKGKKAEDIFCQHLEKLGWIIIKRNFSVFGVELDVLARSPSRQMVLFEVKTCDDLSYLEHRVSPKQRRRIERAYSVMVDTQPGLLLQLGVVSHLSQVEVFPNFFI